MSFKLQSVSSEPRQSTAIVPPPSPNLASLPQELLNQILGKLGPRDLQAAACVSRGMNRIVKEAANFNEPYSIKNFIKILMLKILMQKMPGQIERLAKIAENINSQNFPNLLLLKGYILDVKAPLINVIKTLDEGTINDLLHHVQPPHFLEDIFTLAALERRIDLARLIPDDWTRGHALWEISKALARAGNIDRSLEVATSIFNENIRGSEYIRGEAFRDISQALIEAGDMDRSLEVAWLIVADRTRGNALWDISKVLAEAGDIDRSLAVATLIPNEETRGCALAYISQALLQAGDRDRALEVATSIPNEEMRGHTLWCFSQVLARAGDRERATAVARLIPGGRVWFELRHLCSLQ